MSRLFERSVPYSVFLKHTLTDRKIVALFCAINYAVHNERIKTLSIDTIYKYSGVRKRDIRKHLLTMKSEGWFSYRQSKNGFVFTLSDDFHIEYAFMSQLYRISKPLLNVFLYFMSKESKGAYFSESTEIVARNVGCSRNAVMAAKSLFTNLGLIHVDRYKQIDRDRQPSDGIRIIPFNKSEPCQLFHTYGNDPDHFRDKLDFEIQVQLDPYILNRYRILTTRRVSVLKKPSLIFGKICADCKKIDEIPEVYENTIVKSESKKNHVPKLSDIVVSPSFGTLRTQKRTQNSSQKTEPKEINPFLQTETESALQTETESINVNVHFETYTKEVSKNNLPHEKIEQNTSAVSIKTVQKPKTTNPVITVDKEITMNTHESVMYIYNTWNEHVDRCGGHLKPSRAPRSFQKYGSHSAANSLPRAISEWVVDNPDWKETWDELIEKAGANRVFNGKEVIRDKDSFGGWSPTLKWFFKNREMWKKDMGLNSFLDGDFNHYDEFTVSEPVRMAFDTIINEWNENTKNYKWQPVVKEQTDSLLPIIGGWIMAHKDDWRSKWDIFLEKSKNNSFLQNRAFDKYVVNLLWLFKSDNIDNVINDKYRTFEKWTQFSASTQDKVKQNIDIFAGMNK